MADGNDRHARKLFLRADADVRPAVDADPETREVGLWGEWEATSDAEPIRHPIPSGPLWIHRPLATRAPTETYGCLSAYCMSSSLRLK